MQTAPKSLTATITDAAGNTSAAFSAIAYVLDTVAPVLQTVATSSDGKIVLTYDGALDDTSTPTAADFAVTVAGDANVVTAVAVSGNTVELTLTTAVQQGQKTTLAYTVGTSPLQDATGNGASNLTTLAVTNKAAGKLGQPGYAVLKNPQRCLRQRRYQWCAQARHEHTTGRGQLWRRYRHVERWTDSHWRGSAHPRRDVGQ